MSDATAKRSTRNTDRAGVILLLVATVIVFAPSLAGDFVWDDFTLIVHNTYAHGLEYLGRAVTTGFWDVSYQGSTPNPSYAVVYRPVVKVAQLLEHEAFGDQPFGYHLVNVLLHAACAALVFLWLQRRLRLSSRDDKAEGRPQSTGAGLSSLMPAALGALIFTVHPARPESVTWISGSPDLFMTLFVLGALIAFGDGDRPRRVAIACVLLALAVLSKEPAVLVPLLIATDIFLAPHASGQRSRDALLRKWRPIAALLASAAAAFGVRFAFVPSVTNDIGPPLEAAVRFAASIGHYLLSTFVPLWPSTHPAIHPVSDTSSPAFAPAALAAFALATVAMLALAWLARRSPIARRFLADALWFVIPLVLVANIVPIGHYTLVSERFLYLPHLGLAAACARGLARLHAHGPTVRGVALAFAAAVVIGLAAITIEHEAHFLDERDLWTYELALHPHNLIAAIQLAQLDRADHQYQAALDKLTAAHARAVEAHDRTREVQTMLVAADTLLLILSDVEQEELGALRAFYEGLEARGQATLDAPPLHAQLTLTDREQRTVTADVADFRVPYATALVRTLDLSRARSLLERIVVDDPTAASAWNTLALARARTLDFDGARTSVAEAERALPGFDTFERTRAAIDRAERALARPAADEVAHAVNIADAQVALGAPEAARRVLAPLLAEAPARPELVMARARADVSDGRPDLAREVISRALSVDPAHAAEWNLALASLAALGTGH